MSLEPSNRHEVRSTSWSFQVVFHLCLAILLTYCLVTQGIVYIPFFLALWFLGLYLRIRSRNKSNGWTFLSIHTTICLIGVMCAILAPGKTADRLMAQEVTLPRARMTIAELREHAETFRRDAYPLSVSFAAGVWNSKVNDEIEIEFPAVKITFREYVQAVKTQGGLSGDFSSCGNCSSLLKGESCNFGYFFNKKNNHQ